MTCTKFPDNIQQFTIFYSCIYTSPCCLMSTTNVWRPSEQVCVKLNSSFRWESNSWAVKTQEVDTYFRYQKYALQRIPPTPIKQNNQCIYQINHTLKFLDQTITTRCNTNTVLGMQATSLIWGPISLQTEFFLLPTLAGRGHLLESSTTTEQK